MQGPVGAVRPVDPQYIPAVHATHPDTVPKFKLLLYVPFGHRNCTPDAVPSGPSREILLTKIRRYKKLHTENFRATYSRNRQDTVWEWWCCSGNSKSSDTTCSYSSQHGLDTFQRHMQEAASTRWGNRNQLDTSAEELSLTRDNNSLHNKPVERTLPRSDSRSLVCMEGIEKYQGFPSY